MIRKTFYLFAILIFTCQTFPQEFFHFHNDYRVTKFNYCNSSGEKGETVYDYNSTGKLSLALWCLDDGSRSSINFYNYDNAGKLIEKYREFSDSLTSSNYYYYTNGKLTGERFIRSDGVEGEVKFVYEKDKISQMICKGLNGWFHGEIYYEYSEDKLHSSKIFQKGTQTGTVEYTYDKYGNLIKEHWDFSGQWSQTKTFEYDKIPDSKEILYTSSNVFVNQINGEKIKREDYNFSDKNGGPSIFEYDKSGKLIKKVFKREDGLSTRTYYIYYPSGVLFKSYRMYSDGKTAVFDYKYNDERKLISRSFIRNDGQSGREIYEYKNGVLFIAELDNFDSWLNGTIVFETDDNNKLLRGVFTGRDGFNADIIFEYDECCRNPNKIRWNFTFGGFQVYQFDYTK